jgi:SET domain-containing protein
MSGSVTECDQCNAITKAGVRCKNRTCVYAQTCNKHTLDVVIKKSSVKDSGRGLFAKKTIEKGDVIGIYSGERMTKAAFDLQNPESDYGYEVKIGHVIDAKNTQSTTMRYANDALSKRKTNARFSTNFQVSPPVVKVKATKRIARLKEIFLSYGPAYWSK